MGKNTRNIYWSENEARYFSTRNTKVLEYLYCGKSSGCKLLAVRRIFLRATLSDYASVQPARGPGFASNGQADGPGRGRDPGCDAARAAARAAADMFEQAKDRQGGGEPPVTTITEPIARRESRRVIGENLLHRSQRHDGVFVPIVVFSSSEEQPSAINSCAS